MERLSLLLCFVLLLTLFVGCGKDSDGTDGASSGVNTNDNIFSTDAVNYKTDGASTYRVIRSENPTESATSAALSVYKKLKDAIGVNVKNQMDHEDGTDQYEILIGDTNRPETAQAKAWLIENIGGRFNDYIICTIGKKIVIYGMTDEALESAASYFVGNYLTETVQGGIKYTYKTEGEYPDCLINGVSISKFNVVRPHLNTSYLTYAEVEKLVSTVREKYGFSINICDDTVTAESEYEIIIGNCERPNVTALTDRDEYKVTVSGKKIYINGGANTSTTIAVTELNKKISSSTTLTDADSFSGSYSQTVATYDQSTYYTPKFYDDFDGDSLDLTKWQWRGGTGNSGWSSAGVNGSRADRSLDPSRVFVKDGLFQIHPYYDAENNVYYGGFIETNGIMKLTYGFIEVSCKIPDAPGFWTSLWLRCNDTSGLARPEIDISESFGNGKQIAANMHTWPGNEGVQLGVEHTSLDSPKYKKEKVYTCPDNKSFNDDFHTFGVLWTPEYVWFTGDGVPYFKYTMGDKATDAECFGKKMWIVLSEAVGFENNTDPAKATADEWANKSQYYVDWIYVYQIDDGRQLMEFY